MARRWGSLAVLVLGGLLAAPCPADPQSAPRPGDGQLALPEPPPADSPSRASVLATIEAVADWQLAHLADRVTRHGGRPQKVADRSWVRCVLFTGVLAAHRATAEARYLEAAMALGERNGWRLGRRKEHADDHCVGQVYLELYRLRADERLLEPTRRRFDEIIARRRSAPIWSWADALFMSPPTVTMLAAATGDRRYLDWLASSWRQTESLLYDHEERLWYRDTDYVVAQDGSGPRAPDGAKLFWGRGNGWVLGGLARVLEHLPTDHPERPRFEDRLRRLAERLVELQGEDGLWRSSLLDGADHPEGETSATALITFGLASGVAQGLLDGDRFLPAVWRAWAALVGRVDGSGRLGWVQPVGREPGPARATDSTEFGSGAMLLAAEQVLRLAGG